MKPSDPIAEHLGYLNLKYFQEHLESLTQQAAQEQWTPLQYLGRLLEGEVHRRQDQRVARRVQAARFPVLKTLDQFDWGWPSQINRDQVRDLFRLSFLEEHANIILLGSVGLGKSHLATALGHAACLRGHSVLFATAVDAINTLTAAAAAHRLKAELKKYLAPKLLILDEVGYLPIDKVGADLLFQIVSHRYESGSMILTTNQPFKNWAKVFNNDSTLAAALLDRILHHAQVVTIQGKSYRMKDQIET